MSVTSAEPATLNRGLLSPEDVNAIAGSFDLGKVVQVEFLPAGLMNRNWRFTTDRGAFAVKRLTDGSGGDARTNLAVMRVLADQGLPVCSPVATQTTDLVFDVDAASYCAVPWVTGHQPRGLDLSIDESWGLGAVLAGLHAGLATVGGPLLPGTERRPTARVADPDRASAEADRFAGLARRAGMPTVFDEAVVEFVEQRKILLEKYAHLRPQSDVPTGPFGWTHGDFQHLNVIWSGTDVGAVIDWDRIRVRMWGEEVARSATLLFGHDEGWLDLERVSAFVAGYRSGVSIADEDLFDAVDRLWWKRMCDYWHLEFHYDRDDHECNHLFLSASRFLSWWTDRRDEVRAAFVAAG